MAIFAKFDGIDGESNDARHDRWVNILNVDWGIHRPDGGASGQSRRRGPATVEDLVLTLDYEKAAPKLQEKCLMGAVIPKLEIEQTTTFGGDRATYLRYELKNVMITSIDINASGNDEAGPPTVVVANNFEKIKVIYTEFDASGKKKGNIDYNWKVGKGSR